MPWEHCDHQNSGAIIYDRCGITPAALLHTRTHRARRPYGNDPRGDSSLRMGVSVPKEMTRTAQRGTLKGEIGVSTVLGVEDPS